MNRWADEHGYARFECSRCGWKGMTDTGLCDRCPAPCDECGDPREEDACVGDYCENCATACVDCGEAVLGGAPGCRCVGCADA
jgi:hypothetical protein